MLLLRRGFSMLELLAVLVITGVVTGLSMSRFSALLAHERVAKASVGIANDIRTGFAIPGRIRRPVRITVDTAGMQLVITDPAQTTTDPKNPFRSPQHLQSINLYLLPPLPPG